MSRKAINKILRFFTLAAKARLKAIGHEATSRGLTGLIWSDDGVRTLVVAAYRAEPFLIRLHVDNLSIRWPRRNEMATPSRPKGEITLAPLEVEGVLDWALTFDARNLGPNTPFGPLPFLPERRTPPKWSYCWSQRAADLLIPVEPAVEVARQVLGQEREP